MCKNIEAMQRGVKMQAGEFFSLRIDYGVQFVMLTKATEGGTPFQNPDPVLSLPVAAFMSHYTLLRST